jgi:Flp pilus assembly protein TadG
MVWKLKFIRKTGGTSAITIAITLFVLIGAASLAIDMGHLYTVRNELQNVADSSALAAVAQLVKDQGGQTVRDSNQALQTAIEVAQTQSQLSGLPQVANGERNDLTIHFGVWDIYAADPSQAWTDLGTTCASDSNANAVRVTIRRAEGLAFGPVANLFARIFGNNFSEVLATATAYLGYVAATQTGTVTVPLAVPQSVVAGLRTEPQSWFARLFAPSKAEATSNSLNFRDLGSDTWYRDSLYKPLFDTTKAYLFVVKSSDSIPSTVINNLKQYYTSGGTAVREMQIGTRLYPLSEYQWASNIKTIFSAFKNAYNAEKDSQTNRWRVMVPVYSTTNPLARKRSTFPWHLVRRLLPGVTDAQACFRFWTQSYPGGNVPVYVDGFANVDITNVTYNSGCVTSGMPYQVTNENSCRNTCSVSVEVPTNQDTLSQPGSVAGGPDNQHINPGAQPHNGAIATMPRLVQ